MIDSTFRQRPVFLLGALVLAQVLLLAFQIKRDHDVRLIRYWAAAVVMPFERGGTSAFSRSGGIWSNYISLRGTRAENEKLRGELDQLRLRNRELEGQAGEAQRLSLLLNFHETHPDTPMLAAQVIGASADPASHTLFLNRGERDRVRRNQAVITPDGIVGKIVEVFPATSQVLLINDKDSGAGALLADTRTHGVVKGSGDPDPRLDYVVNDEPVHTGERILTSGEDRIFPKDLLIGTVSMANQGNPFQVIHVRPAARLDRLEDVLILLTPQELKRPNESADASSTPGIVQKEAPPSSPVSATRNVATPNRAEAPAGAAAPPAASPATQPPASAPPAPQD
ncbi:MAG TPA: rod shape-determining protein MreC [Candidatus Acidoferrales bacterium]|nr:rod shape-determining protein MreC [Candidatus Acidoferrales bacterium]